MPARQMLFGAADGFRQTAHVKRLREIVESAAGCCLHDGFHRSLTGDDNNRAAGVILSRGPQHVEPASLIDVNVSNDDLVRAVSKPGQRFVRRIDGVDFVTLGFKIQ